MTDLFDHRSSKTKLYDFIKSKGRVKTSEIIQWGCRNFSNRADRNARQLAEEGLIKRMDKEKKIRYYGNIGEDVWEVI